MRILVVDDEENVRRGIETFFELRGARATGAADYESGLALALSGGFDAAIVDVRLGERDGLGILRAAREADPDLPVVMVSGHAGIPTALEAVRSGALDFLEKPLDQGRLEALLASLSDRAALKSRASGLEEAWLAEHVAGRGSRAMSAALSLAKRAAPSRLCVLIQGASGTGKELFARYAHLCSARSAGPFVAVNCAAIPAELFESELFGYRKGSFTGALADRGGFFQAASGGSLFLDEIGDLPLPLQSKLLRALEYGEIQRVGCAECEKADVRLIAATNADLRAAVERGAFREDLYFRLAQVDLRIPPLEERREDIPALARHFLRLACAGRPEPSGHAREFSPEALDFLASRRWKGNVRELKNLVERAAWLCESRVIGVGDLSALADSPAPGLGGAKARPAAESAEGPIWAPAPAEVEDGLDLGAWRIAALKEARAEFDRRYVKAVLEAHGGSVAKSAKALGILPNNLSRELRALGLGKKRGGEGA